MSQVTILGVSQDKLLENTQAALEGFQNGRPVKRDALVRKALATILGQSNEHLPTAKFADDNANIESRVETLLSGFNFLQDWGSGNDEYIDRYFECRALDDNAEEDDITVDYRLSFNMESKFAYFIIGKNYGDGMNDCIEVPLEMVPHLPHWQPEGGFHLPENVNGKEELFGAYAEMLELYQQQLAGVALPAARTGLQLTSRVARRAQGRGAFRAPATFLQKPPPGVLFLNQS